MSFTSYEFVLSFFVLLVLYYILPKRFQNLLLLLASYVFYFYAGIVYPVYLILVTVITYIISRLIGKNIEEQDNYLKEHKAELDREEKRSYKKRCARIRYRIVAIGIILLLFILVVAKYANVITASINGLLNAVQGGSLPSFLEIAFPLGISFYTLRAIGYLLDVYWGKVKVEHSVMRIALYLSFFPLIPQGPITSYVKLSETLYSEHSYDSGEVAFGLQRMLWGYLKKLVIADHIMAGVNTIVGNPSIYNGAYVFVGMVFYTLELYADFSGGIDITIGIAQCFGITVEENFNRPYFSKSLKEYWRRWHITLCNWFRTYLFYPVSISRPMQKISKFCRNHFGNKIGRRIPVYLSSLIVWIATGIWHGFTWNFAIWGLVNWAILMISEEMEPLYAKFHEKTGLGKGKLYCAFEMIRTFLLKCMINMFDCYEPVGTVFGMFASLFLVRNWSVLWDGSLMRIGLSAADYIILLFGIAAMFWVSVKQEKGTVRDQIAQKRWAVRYVIWFGLFVAVLMLGTYGIGYDASQFIYNQF